MRLSEGIWNACVQFDASVSGILKKNSQSLDPSGGLGLSPLLELRSRLRTMKRLSNTSIGIMFHKQRHTT